MRAIIHLYIRTGSLFGDDFIEMRREIELPFTPFVGLKLQLSPIDFSKYPEYVDRLREYDTLAGGIVLIEDAFYNLDEQIFTLVAWETAGTAEERDSLADQWQHTYGMERVGWD